MLISGYKFFCFLLSIMSVYNDILNNRILYLLFGIFGFY